MKKAQSTPSNPASVEEKAPADLPLPAPMELAKLAAILRPQGSPNAALKTAMEFYVEAVFFLRELLPSSFEELVIAFGSEKRWTALAYGPVKEAAAKQWADALELDPAQGNDAVRSFLAEKGLRLKTATSVINNVRRYWQSMPTDTFSAKRRPSADSIIARCKRDKNGRTTYEIPKFLLEGVVRYAKQRRGETKRKAWKTRQKKSSV